MWWALLGLVPVPLLAVFAALQADDDTGEWEEFDRRQW